MEVDALSLVERFKAIEGALLTSLRFNALFLKPLKILMGVSPTSNTITLEVINLPGLYFRYKNIPFSKLQYKSTVGVLLFAWANPITSKVK